MGRLRLCMGDAMKSYLDYFWKPALVWLMHQACYISFTVLISFGVVLVLIWIAR